MKSENISNSLTVKRDYLVWLVGFYGVSTLVGYLTPNSFLYK